MLQVWIADDGTVERLRTRDGETIEIGAGSEAFDIWLHGDGDEVVRVVIHGSECPSMVLADAGAHRRRR